MYIHYSAFILFGAHAPIRGLCGTFCFRLSLLRLPNDTNLTKWFKNVCVLGTYSWCMLAWDRHQGLYGFVWQTSQDVGSRVQSDHPSSCTRRSNQSLPMGQSDKLRSKFDRIKWRITVQEEFTTALWPGANRDKVELGEKIVLNWNGKPKWTWVQTWGVFFALWGLSSLQLEIQLTVKPTHFFDTYT